MEPFISHKGLVVPLDRANVDTDAIIPKQFLKRIERTGFGQFLFYDWRYQEDGSLNPSFVLNLPRYQGASVLLARDNFGCGSSREHAPWALKDYGFRVIIAPSFADIFRNNCLKNGLLLITLDIDLIDRLFEKAEECEGYKLEVNLEKCTIDDGEGLSIDFQIDPFQREILLKGLDDISATLQYEEDIAAYEASQPVWVVPKQTS